MTGQLPMHLRFVGVAEHDDDRCRVRLPWSTIGFRDPSGELERWLREFDGARPTSALVEEMERSGFDHDLIEELVVRLTGAGALVDRHHIAGSTHALGENPQAWVPRSTVIENHARVAARGWDVEIVPSRSLSDTPLERIARVRRSVRRFTEEQVGPTELASILRLAYSAEMSSVPSAGALRPCELRVLLRQDDGWDVLAWDPVQQTLTPSGLRRIYSRTHPVLQHALESDDVVGGCAAIVVVFADLHIQAEKYGNRGYRFAVLEAGHIAQMTHLAAVDKGLSTTEWGAFRDRDVARLFQIGGMAAVTAISIGVAAPGSSAERSDDDLRSWVEQHPEIEVGALQEGLPGGGASCLVVAQTRVARTRKVVSTGTGWTQRSALARATGEAIERQALANPRIDFVGPLGALSPEVVVPTSLLPKEDLAAFALSTRYKPFDAETSYEWTFGTDVTGQRYALPIEMIYFVPTLARARCALASSNGVAAARSFDEAAEAALHESIERDAFVRTWISRTPPSCWEHGIAWADDISSELATQGRVVSVHRFDAALPTIGVAIRGERPALVFGMATRPDPEQALAKAMQEALASLASQMSEHHEDGPPSGPPRTPADHARYFADTANASTIRWFFDGASVMAKSVNADTLVYLRQRAVRFDITPPNQPLRVVRTLVPELRPIWFQPEWRPSDAPDAPHFFA